MSRRTSPPGRSSFLLLATLYFLAPLQLSAQLGAIGGQIRLPGGELPPERILVELQSRGATLTTTYADYSGRFGFSGLVNGVYHVIIKAEGYEPVDEFAKVDALRLGTTLMRIVLRPAAKEPAEPPPPVVPGGNPHLVSLEDYLKKLPPQAVEEFEAGTKADQAGKVEQAVRHYKKAVELAPDFYQARNNLGSAYLRQRNLEAAEEEFLKVVELNQNDANAYINLANVCYVTERYQDALEFLAQGLARDSRSTLGHFLQGSVQLRLGRLEEAEESLKTALELDPAMPQTHLELVNLYLTQQQPAKAIQELETFIQLFPDHPLLPRVRQSLAKLQEASVTP